MVSSQLGQMQDGVVNMHSAFVQAARDRNIQSQLANAQTGFARQDQLDADYNRDLATFAGVQSAYTKALASTEAGSNTADKIASLYNFFSVIDPGRAVQGNEAALYNNIGGLSAKGENWWRSIFGKGIDETTADEIRQAVYKQYQPEYERAVRQKNYYDSVYQKYWDAGYSVISPRGSLGIDWTPGQAPPAASGTPTTQTNDAVENGDGTMTIMVNGRPVVVTPERPVTPRTGLNALPPSLRSGGGGF